jgi:glyoxylase-like metal-dependent hydrolase (beta-lactamase superfamily II)
MCLQLDVKFPLTALLVFVGSAAPLNAQPLAPPSYERTQLAEGVYAFVFNNPLGPAVDGTSLVVINDDDVLVVDAQNTLHSARAIIGEIRKLTNKPVKYVVTTHWHGDHHAGNMVYQETFPGVEFIAHRNTRIDIDGQHNPGMARFKEQWPQYITRYEQQMKDGKRSDGTPLTAEDSTYLKESAALIRWLGADAQVQRTVMPTLTVDKELILHRGKRTIEIRHMGRGNTRGDLVVFLPNERVVARGDLLVNPVPYSFGSYLGEWMKTLHAISALPVDVIVPGHGAIQRDRAYLNQFLALLETTLTQTKAAVAKGLDLEATRKAVNLDSMRIKFTNGERARERAFAAYFTAPAVERAFLEAKGELDKKP